VSCEGHRFLPKRGGGSLAGALYLRRYACVHRRSALEEVDEEGVFN